MKSLGDPIEDSNLHHPQARYQPLHMGPFKALPRKGKVLRDRPKETHRRYEGKMNLEEDIRLGYLQREHGQLIDRVYDLENLVADPYLKDYRDVVAHLRAACAALSSVLDRIESELTYLRGKRGVQ